MRPAVEGVLEVCLYVEDIARSVDFYQRMLGFEKVVDLDGRGYAMHVTGRQLLLLFKKGASTAIPTPHDGNGELHVAFAIPRSDLAQWESWLHQNSIEIEERKTWGGGGQSLYFRDPDRHLVELATPGTWPVY